MNYSSMQLILPEIRLRTTQNTWCHITKDKQVQRTYIDKNSSVFAVVRWKWNIFKTFLSVGCGKHEWNEVGERSHLKSGCTTINLFS